MKRDQGHISSAENATLYFNERKGMSKLYSHLTSTEITVEEGEGNSLQGIIFFSFFLVEEFIE